MFHFLFTAFLILIITGLLLYLAHIHKTSIDGYEDKQRLSIINKTYERLKESNHDFYNCLTIVKGNVHIVKQEDGHPRRIVDIVYPYVDIGDLEDLITDSFNWSLDGNITRLLERYRNSGALRLTTFGSGTLDTHSVLDIYHH